MFVRDASRIDDGRSGQGFARRIVPLGEVGSAPFVIFGSTEGDDERDGLAVVVQAHLGDDRGFVLEDVGAIHLLDLEGFPQRLNERA